VAELNPENIKSTNEELSKTLSKLSEITGLRENDIKLVLQQKDLLRNIMKEEGDRVDNAKELYDIEANLTTELKQQIANTRKLKREARDIQRSWEEQLEDIPEAFTKLQKLSSVTSNQVIKEFEKQAAEAIKSINKVQREGGDIKPVHLFNERDAREALQRVKEIREEIDKIDDRAVGKGLITRMQSTKAGFSDIKKGWKDGTGNSWRTRGSILKQKGAALKGGDKMVTGAALKGAGTLLAGASRLVPVLSGVVVGLSKLNSLVNDADRLVKGARTDYQKIAGAQFAGGEFAEIAKSYNVEIRDIARNTSLGVDHNEWNAMFSSMANAGMTLEATGNKLGSMGDVMETVRRSSLTLGTTLDITGEIFAEQSQEMRSGLKTIQEGMLEVAKGAKIAGMETNKFYQYILQSTMAMATYGNFTKEAANATKKMSTSAGLTQDEGAKLGGDIASWSSKLTHIQRVNLGSQMLSTGVDYEGYREKLLASQREKLKSATTEEERDGYKVNIHQLEGLEDTADKADGMAQMINIRGAESSPELFMEAVRMFTNKDASIIDALTKGSGLYQEYTGLGISNEMMEELQRGLLSVATKAKEPFAQLNNALKETSDREGEDQKEHIGYLQEIADIMKKGAGASESEIAKVLDWLSWYGVESEDTKGLLKKDAVAVGEMLSSALKSIAEGKEGWMGDVDLFAEKYLENLTKAGRGFEGESLTVSGQDEMIEALTPLEKMTKIAKDSIVYSMSDSKAMQTMVGLSAAIRTTAVNILNTLQKEFFGTDDTTEHIQELKITEKSVQEAVALRKELGELKDKFFKDPSSLDKDEVMALRDKYERMIEGSSLDDESKENLLKLIDKSVIDPLGVFNVETVLTGLETQLGGNVEKALFSRIEQNQEETEGIIEGGGLRQDQEVDLQQGVRNILFEKQGLRGVMDEGVNKGTLSSHTGKEWEAPKDDLKPDSKLVSFLKGTAGLLAKMNPLLVGPLATKNLFTPMGEEDLSGMGGLTSKNLKLDLNVENNTYPGGSVTKAKSNLSVPPRGQ